MDRLTKVMQCNDAGFKISKMRSEDYGYYLDIGT